jgi:hypothetical protein
LRKDAYELFDCFLSSAVRRGILSVSCVGSGVLFANTLSVSRRDDVVRNEGSFRLMFSRAESSRLLKHDGCFRDRISE